MSWINISLLRDFLDKADDLLSNEEVKIEIIKLLDNHKVNFSRLVVEILKYHSSICIGAYDRDLKAEKISNEGRGVSDYLVSKKQSDHVLFVEIKFRKRNYSS